MDETLTKQLFQAYDLAFNLLAEYVVADLTMGKGSPDHILSGKFNLTDWIRMITFAR